MTELVSDVEVEPRVTRLRLEKPCTLRIALSFESPFQRFTEQFPVNRRLPPRRYYGPVRPDPDGVQVQLFDLDVNVMFSFS